MITIYKSTDAGLITVETSEDGAWVNAVSPSPDEIAQLEQWGISREFVLHSLDVNERPRVEEEDSATLVLLRLPYAQGPAASVPFITVPLGIVSTGSMIATICSRETEVLQEFTAGNERDLSTAKPGRFVLLLLLQFCDSYLNHLQEINAAVDALEDKLQRSLRNQEVMELLKYQKSLVYFTTALTSTEPMLDLLQKERRFHADPEDEGLLENALVELRQALEVTEISENILSQMMDAFASIISNNLNVVVKVLTSVTIVISLPTLIASLSGMNVRLPAEEHPQAFLLILGVGLALSLVVAIVFWRKDWL